MATITEQSRLERERLARLDRDFARIRRTAYPAGHDVIGELVRAAGGISYAVRPLIVYDDLRAEIIGEFVSITDTGTHDDVLLAKDEALALREWLVRVLL